MSVMSNISGRSDFGKINQLFDKINSANNIEIEERSIKNIAQKVQLNLLTPQDLAQNYSAQIGYLLQWINRRYSHATSACLVSTYTILAHTALCEEGKNVLNQLGAQLFLSSVLQESDDINQKEAIQKFLTNMVNCPITESVNPFQTFQRNGDQLSQQSILSEQPTLRMQDFEQTSQHKHTVSRSIKADFVVVASDTTSNKIQTNNQTSQLKSTQNGQNILHSAHMEILHKNQCLKEPCELPFVHLSDQDEKLVFDISVQLKFGDFRTVLNTTQSLDLLLQDFPVEVLLQRTDTIKALLDLLEGGSGGQNAFSNLAQQQLITLCRRFRQLYKFNTNILTKKSAGSNLTHEYLQMSYPSCKEGVWNTMESVTDLKKYGAQLPSEKMAAAALQGSLSCRAVLGLIITKSVYLLKDTEKIGLYIQLIKEAWSTVLELYQVTGNQEFTELLHLILFAFDSVSFPVLIVVQVCDFYRDQIFEEVLIQPILDLALVFVQTLTTIALTQTDRFKNPFSETFFKNTEKLQMTLRRGLFTLKLAEMQHKIILEFFQRIENDLPQINFLQKQVTQSYNKAMDAYHRFIKVHNYRLSGNNFDDMCFVDSLPQLTAAIDILETLEACIEMKLDFPFEHLIMDCIVYSMLLQDQDPASKYLEAVERIFVTYLALPVADIRERILRRMFQRVRIVQAFQQQQKYKVNNNYLLAKFTYRKRVLNCLVNGLLINLEVASENTKLQVDIGTLIIKVLVVSYTEAGLIQQKNSNLNSYLLTFQSLLPKYPDLLGLIDLIEENGQQNCRYLRLLRDLFNKSSSKREFSTQILHKSISKDCQQHFADFLALSVNLDCPQADLRSELDLINLQNDFSSFDTVNIQSILMNVKSDYSLRKSSLEQLTLLLFDQNKKGKTLFINQGVTDVFSFVIQEVLAAFKSAKVYLGEMVYELPHDQQSYIEQCFRFLTFAYIFYAEESVVKALFDNLRVFTSANPICEQFEQLLNACVFFCGSHLRQAAMKLLFVLIFNPVLLKTKIAKIGKGKQVQLLIPDFFAATFLIIVPNQVQVVRQPMREDLMLSEEQKDFISAMLAQTEKEAVQNDHLSQIALQFVNTSTENYHDLMQSFEQFQNYLLSISDANQNLVSVAVLQKMQEMLRMLPTKDFEFNFLADFCMFTNQILTVVDNISNSKQMEAFVQALCLGLKFHMLPYLYEVNMSGLDQELCVQHSPKLLFFGQFLDLILNLGQADSILRRKNRMPSCFAEAVLSTYLINYLCDLQIVLKDKQEHRHKILKVIALIFTNYETRNLQMERVPQLFLSTVSQHRLSYSFQGNSLVMTSIKLLIQIYQQRLSHIQLPNQQTDLDQHISLSQTASKVMQEFQSSGWISRFTECKDARLRCLSWDVLTEMFDYQFFRQNQSLVHQSLSTLQREGELYCVKISVLKFINKLCDCLVHSVEACQEVSSGELTVKMLLDAVNKQGFISQIHSILVQKDCPLLMISLLLKFLSNLVKMDFKRALPILTQLDYWTVLVDLINLDGLAKQDLRENRSILIQIKQTILHQSFPNQNLVYMCINSVLEFTFDAMKRDSQLANLLVKTTKLMPAVFSTLKSTLANSLELNKQKNMQGLILICIDKCTKLMHLALLHPRDHTLQMLHNLIDGFNEGQYGWSLVLQMFGLVGSKHSLYFYGHIDVKLAICRFVAEYLLRVQQQGLQNNLDQMISKFDTEQYMQNSDSIQDLSTYGSQLLLEFGKVFRALYVDQRDSRQQQGVPNEYVDHENSKIDICVSLSILCGTSKAAKVQSIEQNLLKKVIEICEENVAALNLSELQKLASKGGRSQPLSAASKTTIDYSRKFKYAQLNDSDGCEREVIRMFGLIKHILFNSGSLLQDHMFGASVQNEDTIQKSFVSQNAMTKSSALRQKQQKQQLIGDSVVSLFGQTLEQIGITSVVEECLSTMITMASQNKRFKNSFLVQSSSLVGSKRNTVMKIVVDALLKESFQSNHRKMHLLFAFLKSTSLSAEVVREISKLRLIEDIQTSLEPVCKNEKDIKILKNYLVQYAGFLAAYAYTEDGVKTIIQLKQAFTLSLFIIDTVTPPSGPEVTAITQLVLNILLFLRNSSMNRVGKQHFISDRAFLPCLMAFLSSRQQHARVRASTAACLWTVLFNHQGVKAALNSDQVRSELNLLQNEYSRICDISKYAQYVTNQAERGADPCAFDIVSKSDEQEMEAIRKMEHFILLAINGILALMDS